MKKVSMLCAEKEMAEHLKNCLKKSKEYRLDRSWRSGEEAVREIPARPPDALLVADKLAEAPALEVVSRIRKIQPKLSILMFTSDAKVAALLPAFAAGAVAFFVVQGMDTPLEQMLGHALAGHMVFGIEFQNRMVRHFLRVDEALLSPAEAAVVKLVIAGKQDKEIAQERKRSPGTIHCMVGKALQKLGIHSRKEVLGACLGLGLKSVVPPEPGGASGVLAGAR